MGRCIHPLAGDTGASTVAKAQQGARLTTGRDAPHLQKKPFRPVHAQSAAPDRSMHSRGAAHLHQQAEDQVLALLRHRRVPREGALPVEDVVKGGVAAGAPAARVGVRSRTGQRAQQDRARQSQAERDRSRRKATPAAWHCSLEGGCAEEQLVDEDAKGP